jgi:NAD(P)-dependent dehydrogenase (short-subunit alcohol dehydrogenase family)
MTTAVITGAMSGIGLVAAMRLASRAERPVSCA